MTNVLPYHVGPRDRYSLDFVNPDREEFKEYLAEETTERGTAFKSREITIETDDGLETLYAVYSNSVPDSLIEDRTEEDIEHILDTEFSEDQIQVLDVILEVFFGITEQASRFTIYKEMNLLKIPDILEYPDWESGTVPEVAGQLLSQFILAHPMPNANHRTAIGLVERYLRSHEESVSVPDTGEEGTWYDWAEPYIHGSKRLLTVRRKVHVFRYAREFGVDIVRRRNDIDINLHEFDLSTADPYGEFAEQHESASIDFVQTILHQSESEELKDASARGWETFVEELRTD